MLLLVGSLDTLDQGREIDARRSFYGVHRVMRSDAPWSTDPAAGLHSLYHGTTLHGAELVRRGGAGATASTVPLAYYHRDGPIGDV